MRKVSQIWFNIQGFLFPFIEKEIEVPLTEKLKQLVATLELIDRLKTTPALRRICGWERASQIPHESFFSLAFAEFAQNGIARIVHESCVKQHLGDHIVGHISRDSTAIEARKKPQKKNSNSRTDQKS
ncbi:MAG: hypothetical protein LWW97_09835 [Deltaproteobacteria bacterium]|nr:hypothetical protein [Deltaproteobacteria bacterium]